MSVVRMPRSAASRKSAAGRPEPDSEPEELLSGRFTQSQWTEMPEYEEAEEAVAEFMEILLDKVMDGCFRAVIRQQLCSYTTNWMKKHLVQIVEQHFLCRDEGDGAEEVLPEDSEPPPAETDAWAQGCVPIVIPSTPLRPISPKDEDIVQKEVEQEVLPKKGALPQPKVSPPSKKTNPKPAVVMNKKLQNIFPQPKPEKRNNQVPIRAKPSKFLPPLSHSTEKQTSKTENSEDEITMPSVSNTSVPSNLLTKHEAIKKLNPASFPDHCIFPKYEIVESNAKSRKPRQNIPPKPKHIEPEWTLKPPRCEVDVRPKHRAVISSGPIRLEAMTLAKGVTLSQSAEFSQISTPPRTPPVKLKPIRAEPSLFRFSIHQFVQDPQVKPLSQS